MALPECCTAAAALLLLVCLAPQASGCLKCTKDAKNSFSVLRQELVPQNIKDTVLKGRAEQLLLGMEGHFFIDYVTRHFTGKMEVSDYSELLAHIRRMSAQLRSSSLTDQALLDALVQYRQNITLKMKTPLNNYQDKACSKDLCRQLTHEVFDCMKCMMVKPKCLSKRKCFVDMQERITLRFNQKAEAAELNRRSMIIISLMGMATFLVLVTVALTHLRNLKILQPRAGTGNAMDRKMRILDVLPLWAWRVRDKFIN